MKFVTKSPEQTEKLGEDFAKNLKPQDVVFLIGNLGSGKTTFTKGIARGLGIKNRILSPTFIVVRSHSTANERIQTLYHLDLYRLKDYAEHLPKQHVSAGSAQQVLELDLINSMISSRASIG